MTTTLHRRHRHTHNATGHNTTRTTWRGHTHTHTQRERTTIRLTRWGALSLRIRFDLIFSSPSDSSAAGASASASLPVIRVGGVPEHFNLSWFIGLESDIFTSLGVRVEWVECKLGTGQMVSALSDGSVDLVVALTEGLITSIATGSDIKLIGTYVQSPLTWAISTGPNSAIREIGDLRGGRIGVSRLTSGSHLMSCVLASQRGWKQSELTYVIEGSFENLRNSVANNKTEAFMSPHTTRERERTGGRGSQQPTIR